MSPTIPASVSGKPFPCRHCLFYLLLCTLSFIIPALCQYPVTNSYLYNPNAYPEDLNSIPVYRDLYHRRRQQHYDPVYRPRPDEYRDFSPVVSPVGFKNYYNEHGYNNQLEGMYPRPRFGQPLPSLNYEDPAYVWEQTSEERESKRQNPLPYIINPGIRRATSSLGQLEAFSQKGSPAREQVLKPLLNLILNPSRR